MRGSSTETFKPNLLSTEYRRRFRNQATGIGQTTSASEETGARRSQCVANAYPGPNPSDDVRAFDKSYPSPKAGGPTDCSTTAACREAYGVPLRGGHPRSGY